MSEISFDTGYLVGEAIDTLRKYRESHSPDGVIDQPWCDSRDGGAIRMLFSEIKHEHALSLAIAGHTQEWWAGRATGFADALEILAPLLRMYLEKKE